MNDLLVYGAVTPPRQVVAGGSTTLALKECLDRLGCRLGFRQRLDYRTYITPNSFNRGDLAIALGVAQTVRSINSALDVAFADWQSLEAHPKARCVLVGGSGYFFVEKSGRLPERLWEDTRWLLNNNVRYGFYGVGMNHVHEGMAITSPKIAKEDADMVSQLLSRASFVSVRDQQTMDALSPHSETPIFLSGDPALYLRPVATKQVSALSNSALRIGINLPFHGPAATDRIRQDLPKYIDCFRRLQQATGAALFHMVHFDTERVIGRLMQDAGLPVTIVNGSVEELQATYAMLDLHVGGMLHSCILSCSVGTPCVGLAYDVKHFGFFELMQMPEFCVPSQPFNADAVLAQCQAALQRGAELRTHIDARRESLRKATEAYLRDALPRLMNTA